MASQLCGHAAMRPCGHAAMRPCGHAAMRPCGHPAIRPSGHPAMAAFEKDYCTWPHGRWATPRTRVTPALRVERIEVKDNFLAAIKRVNKISRLDRVSATQLKTVFRQLGLDQSDSMINKTFKAKDGCPTGKQISHMIRGIEDDTLLKWEAKRVAIPPRAPSPAVLDEIAIIQPEDTGRKSLTEMLRSQPAPLRPNVPHSLLVHLLFSVARLVVPEDTVDTRRRVIEEHVGKESYFLTSLSWQKYVREETLQSILQKGLWMDFVVNWIIKELGAAICE